MYSPPPWEEESTKSQALFLVEREGKREEIFISEDFVHLISTTRICFHSLGICLEAFSAQ
jgi:hypothetical protein